MNEINKVKHLMESPLRNISTVIRYSGFRLLQPETVDSHTIDMAVMGLIICDDLANFIDRKDLIYRIVIHDLEESCSCDVPRSLKYFSPEVHAAIEKATKAMVRVHVSSKLFEDMCNAKDLTKLEGRVVKFLDILQCCFILKKEVISLGNNPLFDVYSQACRFLADSVINHDLFANDLPEVKIYFRSITDEFLENKNQDWIKVHRELM